MELSFLFGIANLVIFLRNLYANVVEEITKDTPAAKTAAQNIKIYSKKVMKEIGKGVYALNKYEFSLETGRKTNVYGKEFWNRWVEDQYFLMFRRFCSQI